MELNQVRTALFQAHDSLSTGDKIAAGIITAALVALVVGVTMTAGGSGAKALTALTASPLLYLGVATAYSKLVGSEKPEAVEEKNEVVPQVVEEQKLAKPYYEAAIDGYVQLAKNAAAAEEISDQERDRMVFVALSGVKFDHPETELQRELNRLAEETSTNVIAQDDKSARDRYLFELREQYRPAGLKRIEDFIHTVRMAGRAAEIAPATISAEIVAAAAKKAAGTYSLTTAEGRYQQLLSQMNLVAGRMDPMLLQALAR